MANNSDLKKRGRPALLLNRAELMSYLEYVENHNVLDQLTQKAVSVIQSVQFDMTQLSDPDLVIVKAAIKPFRELQKVQLVFAELSKRQSNSAFETAFLQVYRQYETDPKDEATFNILKTMTIRYLRFKDNKIDEQSLKLYLSQLEKRQHKAKRNADNHRKFELGGAVLAAFKQLNIDIHNDTPEQIKNKIINHATLHNKIRQSKIFKQVQQQQTNYFKQNNLFIDVLEGLSTWTFGDELISMIEIKKHKNNHQ